MLLGCLFAIVGAAPPPDSVVVLVFALLLVILLEFFDGPRQHANYCCPSKGVLHAVKGDFGEWKYGKVLKDILDSMS